MLPTRIYCNAVQCNAMQYWVKINGLENKHKNVQFTIHFNDLNVLIRFKSYFTLKPESSLTSGKCSLVGSSRNVSPQVLRDDPNNGYEEDYGKSGEYKKVLTSKI